MCKRGAAIFIACSALASSSVNKPGAAGSLDDGYCQMYNLEFDAAHKTFVEWEQTKPDDPLGPASNAAAYLFAEFDRLHIL